MIWDSLDYFWKQNFKLAKEHYLTYGNLDIPTNYKSTDGKHLGNWILRQRQLYKSNSLTDEQIKEKMKKFKIDDSRVKVNNNVRIRYTGGKDTKSKTDARMQTEMTFTL